MTVTSSKDELFNLNKARDAYLASRVRAVSSSGVYPICEAFFDKDVSDGKYYLLDEEAEVVADVHQVNEVVVDAQHVH